MKANSHIHTLTFILLYTEGGEVNAMTLWPPDTLSFNRSLTYRLALTHVKPATRIQNQFLTHFFRNPSSQFCFFKRCFPIFLGNLPELFRGNSAKIPWTHYLFVVNKHKGKVYFGLNIKELGLKIVIHFFAFFYYLPFLCGFSLSLFVLSRLIIFQEFSLLLFFCFNFFPDYFNYFVDFLCCYFLLYPIYFC